MRQSQKSEHEKRLKDAAPDLALALAVILDTIERKPKKSMQDRMNIRRAKDALSKVGLTNPAKQEQ